MSKGFAVSVSMMAAVEPNEWGFSKAAFAVSLGDVWIADSPVQIFDVGVSVIFALYPAWRASKLKPVEALRYE